MLTQEEKKRSYFLDTKKRQPEIVKIIKNNLSKECAISVNNFRRYKIVTTMVMFYTKFDISNILKTDCRVTDMYKIVEIDDIFFSVVLLTSTKEVGGWKFAENISYKLQNKDISCRFDVGEITESVVSNVMNFLDNFLFDIKDSSGCF